MSDELRVNYGGVVILLVALALLLASAGAVGVR
jgi:hypothetical protein